MSSYILILFSLLLFVLNIPGTMALRNVTAVVLLILLVRTSLNSGELFRRLIGDSDYRKNLVILIILTVYIFFHSILVSHEMLWSLGEFKSHWVYPMLYFVIGILLALSTSLDNFFSKEMLVSTLFLSLFAHIFYADMKELESYLQAGHLNHKVGGMIGAELSNYITNILLGLSVSELIYRYRLQKKMMLFSDTVLWLIVCLLLFSVFIESMRNGALVLLAISLSGLFFVLYHNDKSSTRLKIFFVFALMVMFLIPTLYSINKDARWGSLLETVPIALDTKEHKYWLDKHKYEIPKLKSGEPVSVSNYERIAWAYQGAKYVYTSPIFGIGYGRNAFGHALQNDFKIDSVRGMHTHSSIIDFSISLGITGTLMWVFFILSVLKYFATAFRTTKDFFSISGFILILSFFVRSLVDSNMRDHMFQQFFLIFGIILTLHTIDRIRTVSEHR